MGIASWALGDENPFSKYVADNRQTLQGAFAGFGQGPSFSAGLGNAALGAQRGTMLDDITRQQKVEEAKVAEQTNVTRSWLEQQGFTDLVPLVDAGQADIAYNEALKRMQPKAPQAPISVGPGETLLDPVTMQPVYQGAPDPQDQFGNEKDLYAQYAGSDPVKMYETVKSGYERVRQSAALQTGAGDMGLIYGYMKMLDPGSVVRESEFATAAQAGSYGEQIQGMVSRVINGERLPESVRQEFVQLAEGIYSETAANLGNINDQFTTRAQNYNVDPSMFIRQPESYKPLQGIVTMPNGNTVKPL
jgi:hypothetical protein